MEGTCAYCSTEKVEVWATPYMADVQRQARMCRECWNLTRDEGKRSEGMDIGPFWPDVEDEDAT